jgi:hypothetical protein
MEYIKGLLCSSPTIFSLPSSCGARVFVSWPPALRLTPLGIWDAEPGKFPVRLHSPAPHPWWVSSLLKFARVSQVGCDHGPWTLPYGPRALDTPLQEGGVGKEEWMTCFFLSAYGCFPGMGCWWCQVPSWRNFLTSLSSLGKERNLRLGRRKSGSIGH